jgi:hypothetical protein
VGRERPQLADDDAVRALRERLADLISNVHGLCLLLDDSRLIGPSSDSLRVIDETSALPLRQKRLFLLATAMLIISFGLVRAFELPESDLLWEIRTGSIFLRTGTIPRTETWAWLIQGRDWMPNSWAWNVVLALVYNAGGQLLLGVLNFLLFCATFALAANFLRLIEIGRPARFGILTVAMFMALVWMTLRPQYADYIALLAWMNVAALSHRWLPRKQLLLLPLLALLITVGWMNFHLSAAPAILLFPAAYWFTGAFLHAKRAKALAPASLLIAAAAAIALLITPFGIEGLTKGGEVYAASRGLITEWNPIDLAHGYGYLTLAGVLIFGALPVVFALVRRQWLFAAAMLGFTLLAADIVRFSPLLILFGLLAAPLLPKRFIRAPLRDAVTYLWCCALVLVLGFSFALPRVLEPERITLLNPNDLRVIPQHSRVLTMAQGGGMVLLYRPDSSPSLDSRNDIYGKGLYLKLASFYYGADLKTVRSFLDHQGVNAVYLETAVRGGQPTSIAPIMQQLHWKKHHFDDAVIWVRPGT